jgi:hypothetical protein
VTDEDLGHRVMVRRKAILLRSLTAKNHKLTLRTKRAVCGEFLNGPILTFFESEFSFYKNVNEITRSGPERNIFVIRAVGLMQVSPNGTSNSRFPIN